MTKYRLAWLIAFLSLTGNAWLLYRCFDLGVTTTQQEAELKYRGTQLQTLQTLSPKMSCDVSKAELISAAGAQGLEVIQKHDGTIIIGAVVFQFSDDSFRGVQLE